MFAIELLGSIDSRLPAASKDCLSAEQTSGRITRWAICRKAHLAGEDLERCDGERWVRFFDPPVGKPKLSAPDKITWAIPSSPGHSTGPIPPHRGRCIPPGLAPSPKPVVEGAAALVPLSRAGLSPRPGRDHRSEAASPDDQAHQTVQSVVAIPDPAGARRPAHTGVSAANEVATAQPSPSSHWPGYASQETCRPRCCRPP